MLETWELWRFLDLGGGAGGGGANRKLHPLLVFELLLHGSSFHPTLPNISNIDPSAVTTKTQKQEAAQRASELKTPALLPHPGSKHCNTATKAIIDSAPSSSNPRNKESGSGTRMTERWNVAVEPWSDINQCYSRKVQNVDQVGPRSKHRRLFRPDHNKCLEKGEKALTGISLVNSSGW